MLYKVYVNLLVTSGWCHMYMYVTLGTRVAQFISTCHWDDPCQIVLNLSTGSSEEDF